MHIFYSNEYNEKVGKLSPEESQHCVGVLRKKEGDNITVFNGKGTIIEAVITEDNRKSCSFEVVSSKFISRQTPEIHLAIAPTKNMERMEWLSEKLQELGVAQITFMTTENSERKVLKTDRIRRKAISAMKQSKYPYLLEIAELTTLSHFLNNEIDGQKYIAHLSEKRFLLSATRKCEKRATLLIGSEGDFTMQEVKLAEENGFKSVSLGKNVLRTETAALAGCCILKFL